MIVYFAEFSNTHHICATYKPKVFKVTFLYGCSTLIFSVKIGHAIKIDEYQVSIFMTYFDTERRAST